MDREAIYLTERYSVTLAQARYLMLEMRNAGLGLREAELILQALAAWNGAGNSAMMQDGLLGVFQPTDATQP